VEYGVGELSGREKLVNYGKEGRGEGKMEKWLSIESSKNRVVRKESRVEEGKMIKYEGI
jgi:hypothetical protein